MDRYICSNCGSNLVKQGDHYHCKFCDAVYPDDAEERASATLKSVLGEAKIEMLANARRMLYDATHVPNPSTKKVHDAAVRVLAIHPEDPLAQFYEAFADSDPSVVIAYLSHLESDEVVAGEIVRWSLAGLESREVGALKDYVERNVSEPAKTKYLSQIEKEAERLETGLYNPSLPRDVFLCYSSADMPRVIEILDLLEQNDFTVFAAFRNLRHGKGAEENYLQSLKEAMASCSVVVYLSSKASRSPSCDAIKVEIPYITKTLPDMGRIEYILDDPVRYPALPLPKALLKRCFEGLEWCKDPEDLVTRVFDLTNDTKKTIHCPVCKAENPAEAAFCGRCGHPLKAPAPEPKPAPAPKPEPKPKEVVKEKIVYVEKPAPAPAPAPAPNYKPARVRRPFKWWILLLCLFITFLWPIALIYIIWYLIKG